MALRVDDGILPAPCGPLVFPGRGVCPAQGLVARLLAPSPLHPAGVVCSNPATLIKKKPRTLSGAGLFLQGFSMGVERNYSIQNAYG